MNMKEYWCIYRITNNINGKTYIGQHKYINEEDPMGKYKGGGILIHRAYKKYGKENFSIEILYKRIQYQETANSMEIWAIEKERKSNPNGCYNIANGGEGISHTNYPEELRQKLREAHKGQIPWNKGKKGLYKLSEETRRKISRANKGRHGTMKGRKQSEESNKKRSVSMKGKNTWMKGKKASEEAKRNISESLKGRHFYNNGVEMVFTYECPEGFMPGMIKRKQQ